MKKFIQRLPIVFLFFSFHLVFVMDSPPKSPKSPRKKLDNSPVIPRKNFSRDCVRTFQLFNPERARQFGMSLGSVMPYDFIITPDEKGIVAALGNGQVIFRRIDGLDRSIELITDGGNVKGAPMIAVGCRKNNDEIVIAFAANNEKMFFYDGAEMIKLVARFEVWSKKHSRDKNAVFTQKKMKRLEHHIQAIAINAQGAHTVATIEFPKPFFQQNRSSLVVHDLKTNETNAAWSHEQAWWERLVMNDDGTLVACSDTRGAIWSFDIRRGDTGMSLSAPTIIQTKDVIAQLNYPSKVVMWYVTDKHELKRLDVRKYLGVAEVERCITPVSFEEALPPLCMLVIEKYPNLSVAYWSVEPGDDDRINIFFRREKDIFDQEENSQKMTCDMGYVLSGSFSYENDSGQRVVEKGKIRHVCVQGNLLAAMTNSGKIRVFKLTEGCGLVIRGRSKSESEIPRHSASKVTKTTKKEDSLNIIEKAVSTETVFKSNSPEPKRSRVKSFPLPQRRVVKTMPAENVGGCEDEEKKKSRKFSISEHPQGKSNQKGQSPEFQRALQQNIISDFGLKKDPDHRDEGPQKKK